MRRSTTVLGLALFSALALATAGAMPAAATGEAVEGAAARPLSDAEADALLHAAGAVREGLAALRALPVDAANAPEARRLRADVERQLGTFLEIAGLSRDEFVALLDAGEIDRDGVAGPGEPPAGSPRR